MAKIENVIGKKFVFLIDEINKMLKGVPESRLELVRQCIQFKHSFLEERFSELDDKTMEEYIRQAKGLTSDEFFIERLALYSKFKNSIHLPKIEGKSGQKRLFDPFHPEDE